MGKNKKHHAQKSSNKGKAFSRKFYLALFLAILYIGINCVLSVLKVQVSVWIGVLDVLLGIGLLYGMYSVFQGQF